MNLEPVVLSWIGVALVGTLYALDAWRTARADYRLVCGARNGTRARRLEVALVRGDLVSARLIVVQEAANLAVGVLASTQPPPPHGRTLLGWVIVSLLILAAAALPVRLASQRRRRARLVRLDQ